MLILLRATISISSTYPRCTSIQQLIHLHR
nr:MAG TPA: hypothetical protein [Caudoviricetes sp.]